MQVGVTGATGFIGSHLTRRLAAAGHEVVATSRGETAPPADLAELDGVRVVAAPVDDEPALRTAFADVDVVAHLAGIPFERGPQTYRRVHVQGTRAVASAAEAADADRLVLSSFLKARPNCGSGYHESKWVAEELVRGADVDHVVCKIGLTYGPGDHVLTQVSRALATAPVFGLVGFGERRMRPLVVDDLVDVLEVALLEDRLAGTTVPVVGPEELALETFVGRIGRVMGREPITVPVPVVGHRMLARLQEALLETPATARAQVRMLSEGLVEPEPAAVCDPLPADLAPETPFTRAQIERGLPEVRRFGLRDLRWGPDGGRS